MWWRIVEQRFRVANIAVLGAVDMVLLTYMVIPIDPFGEEAVRPVVVLGDGSQDRDAGLV